MPSSHPLRPLGLHRPTWLVVLLVAGLVVAGLVVPAVSVASATTMAPACDGVNVRTKPSTSATIKARLSLSAKVTVVSKVSGSSWATACPGWKSGSAWYRISHVNGKSVSSLYGVTYLYAATGVLRSTTTSVSPSPTPTPTPTSSPMAMVPACDGVNVRTKPSTSATIKARLSLSAKVTVVAKVSGSSWSTQCPTSKSGSAWYRVSHVNGKSVSSLYGVTYLYAASGVLKAAATSSSPAPSPTPSPSPTPAASPAASPTPVPSPTPTPSPIPVPSGATALGSSVTFHGRGWGHGVGLSQHGARGRALAGQTAEQILAHYYQGTTLGTIAAGTQIRVLLVDDLVPTESVPLRITGRSGTWTIPGIDVEFPADARLQLTPSTSSGITTWRLVVEDAAGTLLDAAAPTDLRLIGSTSATTFQLHAKPTSWDLFRGSLRILISGAKADVVNELPLETYLRGVVPAEMPSSWPTEALRAQAIAARSYAAYRLRPGVSHFDAYDDTRSQVYLGVKRETSATNAVISGTANQVLRSGSAIANAMFHSTGGGATEHNENVFTSSSGSVVGSPVSYLRGSADRNTSGTSYDAGAPYATWQTRAYALSSLSSIFAADSRTNVGSLAALDLRNRGVSGRLISVKLVGSLGSKTVSGSVFTSVFNAGRPAGDAPMRSTLFDLAPVP